MTGETEDARSNATIAYLCPFFGDFTVIAFPSTLEDPVKMRGAN
jgi:hypothetical protein